MANDQEILSVFERLALQSGRVVYEMFKAGCAVGHKADASPVTEADRAAEEIILLGLNAALPDLQVVAEEAVSEGLVPTELANEFILVDPLDGTREFVDGRGDFTVNIALVRGGVPVIGVVYAPARSWLFGGRPGHAEKVELDADFQIRDRHTVSARNCKPQPDVVASMSHRNADTDRMIAELKAGNIVTVGSSLKFCIIAEGGADIYPRCGRTMQWDTAAGDAVLRAAGGSTRTLQGDLLSYGLRPGEDSEQLANPWFIARGCSAEPA